MVKWNENFSIHSNKVVLVQRMNDVAWWCWWESTSFMLDNNDGVDTTGAVMWEN